MLLNRVVIKQFSFALLLAGASFASAGTVSMNYTGMGKSMSGNVTVNGKTKNVYVGVINFSVQGGGKVSSVCADFTSQLNGNSHSYSLTSTAALSTNLRHAGNIVSTYFSLANTNAKAAGLQLAVWDAIYNGGNTFGSGEHFSYDRDAFGRTSQAGTAAYYAAQYYQANTGNGLYFGSSQSGAQSQIAATPEPVTMIGGVAAIAGFIRRRRSAK